MAIKSSNLAEAVEELIELAQEHGEESEPEMEVGDLQAALRVVWQMLTEDQQRMAHEQILTEVFGMEGSE
jgi:hypothetical protein